MKDIWIGDHFQNFRISLQYSSHLGKKNTPLTWPNKNNSTHLKTRRCNAVQCVSVQFCLFFWIIYCLLCCVVSCFALCCLLLHCVECCMFLFCIVWCVVFCVVLCVANQPSVQCGVLQCNSSVVAAACYWQQINQMSGKCFLFCTIFNPPSPLPRPPPPPPPPPPPEPTQFARCL